MKALKANVTSGLCRGSRIPVCDNSGAKLLYIISFRGDKGVRGRKPSGGVGDFITASVKIGDPDMRKKVVNAVIVRQKKEYKRSDGTRIKFEDNAAVVLKDEKGNPSGTLVKGPIAREIVGRWPAVAKIAKLVV
ncbi:50S ribosomal protein L14 [Candidatus Woesearchaeota archaeon]|nr:50S ribosomal protein L14P [uncultured archaeon]MBS3175150.1 50S ribosomal protein L14 [Candidatus Woesearchaeota archaeon]